MKLSGHLGTRDNNFNLLRLIAATAVIYSHAYGLLLGPDAEWLKQILGRTPSVMAVDAFFAISGFLVSHSWLKQESLVDFIHARVFRIFPALLVVLLLTVFVVGPLCTTETLPHYFQAGETWKYLYKNFLMIHTEYELPGVFQQSPHDQGVNGSLWTLQFELKMYVAVALAGLLGVYRDHRLLWLAIAVYFSWYFSHHLRHLLDTTYPLTGSMPRVSLFFMFGVLARLAAHKIVINFPIVLATVLLAWLARTTIVSSFFYSLALVTAILYFAYLPGKWLREFNRLGDYSYGTYLYAFPIQQMMIQFITGVQPLVLFALATLATWFCAVCSWHTIEKPALNYLRKR